MTNTLQEQIEYYEALSSCYCDDAMLHDILASLRRLAAIDSAEMPEYPRDWNRYMNTSRHADWIEQYVEKLRTFAQAQSAQHAKLRLETLALVKWLEEHQPDVFKRGLWDAIQADSIKEASARADEMERDAWRASQAVDEAVVFGNLLREIKPHLSWNTPQELLHEIERALNGNRSSIAAGKGEGK